MTNDVRSSAAVGLERRRASWRAWLLLAPMVLWLVLFVVLPSVILLVYSFCERDELGRVVYTFTTENFIRVFDPVYVRIFARSIGYAGLTTIICVVVGYPVAFCVARAREEWRQRLLLLVMIPFWTSFLIRTYAWITILKKEGLLNGLLEGLALPSVELLYTPTAVIIGLVYAYLPFMILPIYGSAEKLDGALIEAAYDLGAGPLRVFSSVIIPLTLPGIAAGTLLVFVPAIGMFAITDLMGGARVPMIGNVIQNQFMQARDWPFGAALGVVFMALFALTYLILLRVTTREEHP
ncbi:ABC transporter permease [Opitutus terrae]|uniref:Binding-protein-dependent transport systems inner membrane component n=1 Tax=Opitutus terrae (strain DSM 11246 / JCM 15787 / PB90-1) TaxID=452637 RepID=B1ZYH4_OPITP|nr:ABC transporter permease [Opitutus terrae]ACB77072.1 binding-protein-dependent transport systems inner membrane component [Opitutus terrae PB90-1]